MHQVSKDHWGFSLAFRNLGSRSFSVSLKLCSKLFFRKHEHDDDDNNDDDDDGGNDGDDDDTFHQKFENMFTF